MKITIVHADRVRRGCIFDMPDMGKMALARLMIVGCAVLTLLLSLSSCALPWQQTAPPDPRLKWFHIVSERILTLDSQAEVDGTVINTSTYRFPFDVTMTATFYDASNNVIGQAQGVAEDVWPGTTRPFTLIGQVDSSKYTHMVVTPISLQERRVELYTPTPPPVVP